MASGPDDKGIASGKLLDDVRDHQLDLFRLDADFRRRILPILRQAEQEILAELRKVDPTGPARQSFKVRRLEAMLPEIRRIIRGGYDAMRGISERDLQKLATAEAAIAKTQLAGALQEIGVSASLVSMSREQIEAIAGKALVEGNRLKDFWLNGHRRLSKRFEREMRAGLAQGESIQDLTRRIKGGTKGGIVVPGVMKGTRREIEGIVRTSVAGVSNETRLAAYAANADIVSGVTHISTLDNRTTLRCIARDGLSWTLEGKPIGGHSIPFDPPPVHFNCRSSFVPLVAGAEDFAGTRASQFGEVPADETFDGFLDRRETRTPGANDEQLGAGRVDLWRRGKISMTDLLDQQGNPITVEQLQSKFDN